MISAKIFSKICVNNFFQRIDNYLKEKIIIYKNYKHKSKKINDFSQSQKIDLVYR